MRYYNLIVVIFIIVLSFNAGNASDGEGLHGELIYESNDGIKISTWLDYPSLKAQLIALEESSWQGYDCWGYKGCRDNNLSPDEQNLCYDIPLGDAVFLAGLVERPCGDAPPGACKNLDERTTGYSPAQNVPVKIECKNENNGMTKTNEVKTDSKGKFNFSFSKSLNQEETGNWSIKLETYIDNYWGGAEVYKYAAISGIEANIGLNDLDSDISKYETLSKEDPNNIEYLTVLGWDYLLKGDCGKAITYFNKVLATDPNNKAAQSGLDQAEAKISNDNCVTTGTGPVTPQTQDKVVDKGDSNTATNTVSSKSGTSRQEAIAWTGKGDALKALGEYEEAIKAYEEAIRINPQHADAWMGKGSALFKMKKYDKSVEAYDEAIRINSQIAQAWNGKGSTLYEQGRYDDAIKAFDEAIRIDQQYALAWYNKGVYLALHLGKYEQALECFKKAVKINPSFKDAWENMAVALKQLHREAEAEESLSKAQELTVKGKT